MKRKHRKQWLSILLSVVMLFTGIIIPSTATAEPSNEMTQNHGDISLDNTTAPVQTELSETIISSDKVTFEEDKNLFSKTTQNEDGTYTMEVFDVPVKYLDAAGNVKEKSLELKDTNTGYVTRQSDITCMFPKDISAGISLTYGDTVVTMVPDIAKSVVKTQHKDGVVSYLTDGKTLYQYSLTYMGYKEDIIVPDYTGQTEYHFTYYTNGLHMAVVDGELVFVDQDGKAVVGLSEVIVFTADDRNNTFGEYRCETIKSNEEYRVTIVLDAEYLKDEKTTYPIVIDPGLELIINYDTGATAIEDATINSTAGTSPNGTTIFVGKRSTKGIARLLVRFPGLDMSTFSYAWNITKARYVMRDLMCYSTPLDVEAHMFNATWAESTVTWNTVDEDNYDPTALCSVEVFYRNGNYNPNNSAYTNSYEFDITAALREWKNNPEKKDSGIIFKTTDEVEAGSEYISVCFASFERSSNKPRLIIEYTRPVDANISDTYIELDEGETHQLSVTAENVASVAFYSMNPSIASINSSTGVITAEKAGITNVYAMVTNTDGVSAFYYCYVVVTIPDGIYYIKNNLSNRYLTTNGQIADHTEVYQYNRITAPVISTTRQMWRIQHIGDGKYVMRHYYKSDMALYRYGTDVETMNITLTDASAPVEAQWSIVSDSTGYIFRNNGNISYVLQPEGQGATGLTPMVVGTDTGNMASRWEIIPAEDLSDVPTGAYLYDTTTGTVVTNPTKYVAPEESLTLLSIGLVASAYSPASTSQSFVWSSSNQSVATVSSSTGTVTGRASGTVTITGRLGSNQNVYVSYTLNVTEIANGTYYILNRAYKKYIQPDNDDAPEYVANANIIEQMDFDGENYQRWIFTHVGDGYYKITLRRNNYVISVPAGEQTTDQIDLILITYNNLDTQKWKVIKCDSGAYQLKAKSSEGYTDKDLVMASETYLLGSNLNVQQREQIDSDGQSHEWWIEPESQGIELEPQYMSEWCWVASARMLSKKYMHSHISQASAAVYIMLNLETITPYEEEKEAANGGGTNIDTKNALEYILSSSNNIHYTLWDIYDETTLRSLLDANLPVLISRGWYNDYHIRQSGHSTVIYDYYYDTEHGMYMYMIYDPSPVYHGRQYVSSYQAICNGRNPAFYDDHEDNGVWEGVVVYKLGNYANTKFWDGTF